VSRIIVSDQKLFRQVKLYLSHRYTGLNLKQIGRRYGISESGVSQARRRVRSRMVDDKKFVKMINKITNLINV
jgi:DNA-directed RNA polymerase specialized sigma subunit